MSTEQSYVGRGRTATLIEAKVVPLPQTAQKQGQTSLLPDNRPSQPPLILLTGRCDDPEVWKPFPGLEDRYELSSYGQVASRYTGRIITLSPHPDGYACLWRPRTRRIRRKMAQAYSIHYAVAIAFLANPLGLPFVKHLDADLLNNRVDNLQWAPMPTAPISPFTSLAPTDHE